MEDTLDPSLILFLASSLVGALILIFLFFGTQKRYPSARKLNTKTNTFYKICDNYASLEEVQEALAEAGMEGCDLIVGVDFTKSNDSTGRYSNDGKSLHDFSGGSTPYGRALKAIASTLKAFDDDNLVPAYGFGDLTTKGRSVFSFNQGGHPCEGLNELLRRYKEIATSTSLKLSGPTDFYPLIQRALEIVRESGNTFHVLLIVADGQVTSEQRTIDAIVEASRYPLSIVVVGVGDGPFEKMEEFDDQLPKRRFDNFQFVNMTALETKHKQRVANSASASVSSFEAVFAMQWYV